MTESAPHDGSSAAAEPMPVEVRRSARRRRTVSADVRNGTMIVSIPASFTRAQEEEWVARMVSKLQGRSAGTADPAAADRALAHRAADLAGRYLGGRGVPGTIGWVTNQNSRWGSATPAHRSIRLSHKLRGMPDWVVDYVILHEMAHLIEPSHNRVFWRLLESYPDTEKAKAFLAGAAFAADHGLSGR
ncbi:M48 family peptidase [Arthrobacter crusticola]|uniref:M48 family peptidase n=1 Tax=Arthrobacter crusticola TaxID=2547960 RepID=A0A4R5TLV7_9MICC|nr:M48 family metallopeptidase [Arthrobacter crusticola]TDK23601.1 M48 family peptidase [Arthrobacter crusticola]